MSRNYSWQHYYNRRQHLLCRHTQIRHVIFIHRRVVIWKGKNMCFCVCLHWTHASVYFRRKLHVSLLRNIQDYYPSSYQQRIDTRERVAKDYFPLISFCSRDFRHLRQAQCFIQSKLILLDIDENSLVSDCECTFHCAL